MNNLRKASIKENAKNQGISINNTSGVVGVCWHKGKSKWIASIHFEGKIKHLGYFSNFDDAVVARKAAEPIYGYHPNHGNRKATTIRRKRFKE